MEKQYNDKQNQSSFQNMLCDLYHITYNMGGCIDVLERMRFIPNSPYSQYMQGFEQSLQVLAKKQNEILSCINNMNYTPQQNQTQLQGQTA